MPIIYVIKKHFNEFSKMYGLVILIAIFTTAISSGISFLNNICKNEKNFSICSSFLCTGGIVISSVGFSKLVKILFPVFGYIGLIQIYFIVKRK